MFAPIPTAPTSVELCERALRRAILERRFAPGERLPPERRLAEQFGVNRVTVRSALGRLAAGGLVAAKQGSGYTVRDYLAAGGPALLPGVVELARADGREAEVLADLLRVRRHMAGALLERLAEAPPGPEALDAYDAAVDAFAAASTEPTDDRTLARADLDVVAALLAASGSPVLALCLNPISSVLAELDDLRAAIYADPASNLAGWRALGELLRALPSVPDGSAALAAVSELLAARDRVTLERLS